MEAAAQHSGAQHSGTAAGMEASPPSPATGGLASTTRTRALVIGLLVLVNLFFGMNAVICKIAVRSVDPVVFSWLRDMGGTTVLMAAAA